MNPSDAGGARHAITGGHSGDGRIDVAAWSPPPACASATSTTRSARVALRTTEHGVVAVVATAREAAGLDLAAAVGRLADGADLSLVADDLWTPPGETGPLGLVTTRIENGTARLAVAGDSVAARLDDGRRRRGLAGESGERGVRAITTAFDGDATIVIQAGPGEIPMVARSDATATCTEYAALLLAQLGWTGHAVLVARSSGRHR